MTYRTEIVTGEWYHCFNRGADRRKVFHDSADYERFLSLLFVSNGTEAVRISDQYDTSLHSILTSNTIQLGEKLVEIGAYTLMPNHVHILVRPCIDGGVSRFMQKVFTGYTMYFNIKNHRTGVLFGGKYKSKHVTDDTYLKQLTAYILLNPAELFDSAWKLGTSEQKSMGHKLTKYPYSSMQEFLSNDRPEKRIVTDIFSNYFDDKPSLTSLIENAQAYYRESSVQMF